MVTYPADFRGDETRVAHYVVLNVHGVAEYCIRPPPEREFFIDNLLVRVHFIIEMVWRTGLAPCEFEFSK